MKRNILLLFFLGAALNIAFADTKLPEKAIGIPKIFLAEDLSSTWSTVVRDVVEGSGSWGDFSNRYWMVYVDRNGVNTYNESSESSGVFKKNLSFMEDFFVAKVEKGFALIYKEKYVQTNLVISPKAESYGWIKLDNLLLWSTCPRTSAQIYQKAVILKDIDEVQKGGPLADLNEVSPRFSASPTKMEANGFRAVELEFYFVYKIVDGSALLIPESRISNVNEMKKVKKGWMGKGNWTSWNERLCYEPNFGNFSEDVQAAVFDGKSVARTFWRTGEVEKTPLWRDKLPKRRWSPSKTRFPVLHMDDNGYIAEVGTIGTAVFDNSGKEVKRDQDAIDKATQMLAALESKLSKINVVFVIDGTRSMRNYYQPVARAVRDAMNQTTMKGANLNFGAVVYRDYPDDDVIEYKQLSTDHNALAGWLVSRDCHSVATSDYEAMYYGIETAIDKMAWTRDNSNFLVLIGDAGNAKPDAKGRTIADLAKKMAAKEINFIAFQANHPDHIAYHDFCSQVDDLLTSELKQMWGRGVKSEDFKYRNRLYEVRSSEKEILVTSAAYHYASVGHSESPSELKELIEKKIVEFNDQTISSCESLRRKIDEMTGDGGDVVVFEDIASFLRERGFPEEYIKALRDKNKIMKVRGFAARTANSREVFVPCVFMASDELKELIQSLSSISRNMGGDRRQMLQSALKKLALSYIGQVKDDMSVSDVMEAVSGLTLTTGKKIMDGVNIRDITIPSRVSDQQIDDFISRIARDVERLNKVKASKDNYFDSPNKLRYYYILLEDMPLQ